MEPFSVKSHDLDCRSPLRGFSSYTLSIADIWGNSARPEWLKVLCQDWYQRIGMLPWNYTWRIVSSPDSIQGPCWRLPQEGSVGSAICQNLIGQILKGCPNTRNMTDDFVVYGSTEEEHGKFHRGLIYLSLGEKLHSYASKCVCVFFTELDYCIWIPHFSTRSAGRQELRPNNQTNAAIQLS